MLFPILVRTHFLIKILNNFCRLVCLLFCLLPESEGLIFILFLHVFVAVFFAIDKSNCYFHVQSKTPHKNQFFDIFLICYYKYQYILYCVLWRYWAKGKLQRRKQSNRRSETKKRAHMFQDFLAIYQFVVRRWNEKKNFFINHSFFGWSGERTLANTHTHTAFQYNVVCRAWTS